MFRRLPVELRYFRMSNMPQRSFYLPWERRELLGWACSTWRMVTISCPALPSVSRRHVESGAATLTRPHHWLDIGTIWPIIGTLDHPELVTPEFRIFTEEQIPWVKLDDGLPRYAKFPPARKGKAGAEALPE